MQAVPPRTPVRGPTFIRLLARLADTTLAPDGPAPAEQLGLWVDWTRAVALSRALDGQAETPEPVAGGDDAAECARARATLAASITADDSSSGATDVAPIREHCRRHQRAMQAATGRLRGRLRDRVALTSPDLARLAEVDAVMEAVLSPREHALLATVPDLLATRFEHLRRADDETVEATPSAAASAWRHTFRNDMRDVLLAELDLRFQPIEGLLAALRSR